MDPLTIPDKVEWWIVFEIEPNGGDPKAERVGRIGVYLQLPDEGQALAKVTEARAKYPHTNFAVARVTIHREAVLLNMWAAA